MWWSHSYKKPIAYSSVADSDAISLINTPNKTPNELMTIFQSNKYLVNVEMIDVIQKYIDKGLGDIILKTYLI